MSRRIDAALNDERIVAAARRVLAERPDAGMDQVAAAAGVGRATLYRRFSTREELLSELREEASRAAYRAVKEARVREGSASEGLERLIASLLTVADSFAFAAVPEHKHVPDPKLVKPWIELIKRGQESGEFSSELPPQWWLAVIRAHFREAATALSAGGNASEIATTMTRAIVSGLGA